MDSRWVPWELEACNRQGEAERWGLYWGRRRRGGVDLPVACAHSDAERWSSHTYQLLCCRRPALAAYFLAGTSFLWTGDKQIQNLSTAFDLGREAQIRLQKIKVCYSLPQALLTEATFPFSRYLVLWQTLPPRY